MAALSITPAVIYMFVQLTGPTVNVAAAYPNYVVRYHTADELACTRQADAWNKAILPLKPMFACFPLDNANMVRPSPEDD
jgi:hypothetical protein